MITKLKSFVRDQRGVTAIEYGLIAGVLALGILGAVGSVGTQLSATFSNIATAITPAK